MPHEQPESKDPDSVIVRDDGFRSDELSPGQFKSLDELKSSSEISAHLDLDNDEDPASVKDYLGVLEVIRIPFPNFTDGRGFSLASRLRQMGYEGRLRACGHVIADQYPQARRSGFDEVEISADLARRQPEHQWKLPANWRVASYQRKILNAN